MSSLKSKLLIGAMRYRHLLKGKLKKELMHFDVDSVLAFRKSCEQGAKKFGKIPDGITIQQEVINFVLSEWMTSENFANNKLIFYVHGGGYVSGSCNDHRAIVSKIALKTQTTTLLYEYGLAPEFPFPTALNDSLHVYKAVLEKGYKPENIVIMGESAGGGLCLSLLLALRDKNIPLPKAAVAIQPWTDLSCSGTSYQTKNKVSLAPLNCWHVFSHFYVDQNDIKDPYISPIYGDLKGLPPIYINVGEADELFDDSIDFYNKAKQAGVDVTLKIGKDMVHCYPLMAPLFKEATEAMEEIVQFIENKLTG